EKVQQARADYLTASLIPNPQLIADSINNWLPGAHPFNPRDRQGGPPQADINVNFPVDWCLFGKRVAAMEAARLGVDVAAADFADLVRQRVADTVQAYYDVLQARELLDLARQDLKDLQRIAGITEKQVKIGGAGEIEVDRARLALYDSQREVRNRETDLA